MLNLMELQHEIKRLKEEIHYLKEQTDWLIKDNKRIESNQDILIDNLDKKFSAILALINSKNEST